MTLSVLFWLVAYGGVIVWYGMSSGDSEDTSRKSAGSQQKALERVESAIDRIKLDKDRVAIDQEMHLGSFR